MDTPTIPVKAIKSIMKKELQGFYDHTARLIRNNTLSDAAANMPYIAFTVLSDKLESCVSYDDLQDYISYAGYAMSLQEWIDSLY